MPQPCIIILLNSGRPRGYIGQWQIYVLLHGGGGGNENYKGCQES